MDEQKRAFEERLARLNAAKGKDKGARTAPMAEQADGSREGGISSQELAAGASLLTPDRRWANTDFAEVTGLEEQTLGSVIFGALKGIVLGVLIWGAFQYGLLHSSDGSYQLMGFAALVISAFVVLTRRRGIMISVALFAMAGMFLGGHNLVHKWPDLFAKIYGQVWVTKLIAETKPCTLRYKGLEIPMCQKEEKKLPEKIKLGD